MSKHNYSQYSKKKYNDNMATADKVVDVASFTTTAAATEGAPVAPEIKMVAEAADTVTLPKTVIGFVSDCTKLNVREQPEIDADVVCVLNNGTEVEINVVNSTNEWFSVCTAAGIEGYCMRKFINARL